MLDYEIVESVYFILMLRIFEPWDVPYLAGSYGPFSGKSCPLSSKSSERQKTRN
jgi:hypothetical protein